MKTIVAAGIDIGGTNTAFGLVNAEGTLLFQSVFPTQDTPEELVQTVFKVLSTAIATSNYQLVGVGIGAPNGNFYNGTIEFAPNLKFTGIVPLAAMFQEAFGVSAILTNDANAAAIGEMQFGVAKGMNNFVVVTLGTGLGSGFVCNGNVLYGHDGFAGELGHTIYDYEGRLCGCGRKGCLETYCSATGIVRTCQEWLAKETTASVLRNLSTLTAKSIADAAAQGDELALKAFEFTSMVLGRALADTVAITSPEAIILFGGLANAGDLLAIPLKHHLEANLLHIFKNKVKVLRSNLKEADAAILGAASLIWHAND